MILAVQDYGHSLLSTLFKPFPFQTITAGALLKRTTHPLICSYILTIILFTKAKFTYVMDQFYRFKISNFLIIANFMP